MEDWDVVYKQVSTWDTADVVGWIRGLDECLSQHISQFQAHCICGVDLLKLSQQQLDYLKVSQIGHQELLLEAVELLAALENGRTRNPTIALASTLSKKTSQLISALATQPPTKRRSSDDIEAAALNRMERTAGVMMAAKSLVNWLDRNPSSLVRDYDSFRQDLLKSSLDLCSILQDGYNTSQMQDSCRRILKLTATMMLPQNFSASEPINLVTLTLGPKDETGLGVSIQRTRQGNLFVSEVIEGSPADESGKIQVGVEIIQINGQNVVGWEVDKVVESLKARGHRIGMVLKMGTMLSEQSREDVETTDDTGSCDSPDQPTNQNPPRPVDLGVNTVVRVSSIPSGKEETDLGIHRPPKDLKESIEPSMDIRRTSSSPLMERERTMTTPTQDIDGVGSSPSVERREGSGKFQPSFQSRLQQRTASEGASMQRKKDGVQKQYPPVAYRTQVVGGVVMRIPIKQEEPAPRGKKQKTKKKPNPSSSSPLPTRDHSVSPVDDDLSLEKGKAIFSDPREVAVDGQIIKQVTVSSGIETGLNREEVLKGKKANPALMVPCFQLKNADHEGWMNKLGGSGLTPKNWRRRWFVLQGKKLYYYKTSFDISALGIVDLVGYTFETAPEMKKKNGFKACRTGARTYYFQPDTSDEMIRWMQVLKESCEADGEQTTIPSSGSIDADDKSDDEL